MPLYEYQCDACSHRFELIQKFSDPPAETCPACGGAVTKLLSSPAIQFKGSGWYITDYARAGKTEGKTEGKGEGTSSEAKADDTKGAKADAASPAEGKSKSDAAPAAKPDGKKTGSKPTTAAPSD